MKDLIKALQIFLKYADAYSPTFCNYDEFCIAHINPNDVSKKDKADLEKLGFLVDEEEERFMSFRYGSS